MIKKISLTKNKEFYSKYSVIISCVVLSVLTITLYWQVKDFDFINFDDDKYVYENQWVRNGFSLENIEWAFTSIYKATWQPLTWLSFMLDAQLFGINPGYFHLTNVYLHIINTLLLFLILNLTTKNMKQSGFVAALFAVHPLHVESVAWITERKDVLSTFFGMLSILSYVWYIIKKNVYKYIITILFFCFSLMSKPMLVTLPFLLLLLDYWPLNRISFEKSLKLTWISNKHIFKKILIEKIPFLIITIISCIITVIVQKKGGAINSLDTIPLINRFINVIVSYGTYISKMILPINLAVLYPYEKMIPFWQLFTSFILLTAVSTYSIFKFKQYPFLIVGWLWFIGSMVPVIGWVQIGLHSMADRFTYVPLIGVFVMISWGMPQLWDEYKLKIKSLNIIRIIIIILLFTISWKQINLWKNSITLFTHTAKVTHQNKIAHYNLGHALIDKNNFEAGIRHYNTVLQIDPNFILGYINLGSALVKMGELTQAYNNYKSALQIDPQFFLAHYNLGIVLEKMGKYEESIKHYKKAVQLNPDHKDSHYNLGNIYKKIGNTEDAAIHYKKAIEIQPDYKEAYNNLGILMGMENKLNQAIQYFSKAVKIDPNFSEAHNNMGQALIRQGNRSKAIYHYKEALKINPDFENAKNNLKAAEKSVIKGNGIDHSIKQALAYLEKNPDSFELNSRLGNFYAMKKNMTEAIKYFEKALSIEPQNLNGLENIAISHAMNGNYLKAIEYIKRILDIQPDNANASYTIATMYARLKDVPATIKWLEIAFEKGFNDISHIKNDINFQKISHSPKLIKFIEDKSKSTGT